MIMRRLLIAFTLSVLTQAAFAWGGFEHSVIAYMAQEHLTENAIRNIRYYLDQPIYEYAEWMDYEPVQYSEELGGLTRHSHLFTVNPDYTYAVSASAEYTAHAQQQTNNEAVLYFITLI